MQRIYFNGNWRGYIEVDYQIGNQNNVDGTTPVHLDYKIGQDSGYSINFPNTNGAYLGMLLGGVHKYLYFDALELDGNSRHLGSLDFTLTHDENGNTNPTLSFWSGNTESIVANGLYWGSLSHSITLPIPVIIRSGEIESVSPNAELGKPVTVMIKDREEGLEHQVWWKVFGGDWIDLGKKFNKVFTFTPSRELHKKAENSDTGKLDICVRTFKNSKQYGRDVYKENIPIKIPEDIKPKISDIRFVDNYTNQKKLNIPIFLQDLSDIDYEIVTATDSITEPVKWHLTIESMDKHYYGKTGKLEKFTTQGEISIKAWAVDKRGRESDVITKTVIVNRYKAPQLSFVARRSGTRNNTVTVTTTAKVSQLTNSGRQYNSFSIEFYTRRIEDTQFIKNEGATLKSTSTYELIEHSANLNGSFNSEQSYMIKAVLRDSFKEVEYLFPLSTEQVVASYSQWGMGIGKIWERGSLDVAGDVYVGGYLAINGNQHSVYLKGDANTMTRSGLFYVDNMKNAPYHAGYLTVHSHSSNDRYVLQEFTPFDSNTTYKRIKKNGIWEEWIIVSVQEKDTWHDASYRNGWKTAGDTPIQYTKTADGTVYLRGVAKSGSLDDNAAIINLPEGYRPNKYMYKKALNFSYQTAIVGIDTNGNVTVKKNVDRDWLCLDDISFRI